MDPFATPTLKKLSKFCQVVTITTPSAGQVAHLVREKFPYMSENDHVDVFNGDIRKSIQALEYPKFSTSSDNIEKSPFSIVNALFAAPNIQHAETIQRDDTHMIHGLMWMNYPSKTASEACTTGTSDVHALVALATASDLCSLSDVVGANYSLLGIEDTLLCSLMPQTLRSNHWS